MSNHAGITKDDLLNLEFKFEEKMKFVQRMAGFETQAKILIIGMSIFAAASLTSIGMTTYLSFEIADIKSDITYVKYDVSNLRTDVNELITDIDGLKTDMDEVKDRLGFIESKVG